VVGSFLSAPDGFQSLHGIRFVACDLRNGPQVTKLVEERAPTHVFHLGAQSSPMRSRTAPLETFDSNVLGSLHLFEAVRRLPRPPVVVLACSSAEYGHVARTGIPTRESQKLNPLHPYGISKVCLDLLARYYFVEHGIPTIRLRVFNTTGPGKTEDAASDFIRQLVQIKRGLRPPVVKAGNLSPRRAFLDVSDAVRGFYLAATRGKPGEVYNLCASQTHSIRELLECAIRITGVQVRIQESSRLVRPHDEKIIFGSSARFRRHTGWKPTVSFEETLASMLDYWQNGDSSASGAVTAVTCNRQRYEA
jgi:GDP-4-dehydro-6-deoxy-D-mannose reductase